MCMNIHPPFLSHEDPTRAIDRDTTGGNTVGQSGQPDMSTVREQIETVPHPVSVPAAAVPATAVPATAEEVLCNA
jgi:hypothetical protein